MSTTCIAKQHPRIDALGLPLDACSCLADAVDAVVEKLGSKELLLTTFINPAAVAASRRAPVFGDLLRRFDLVLPDGIGMSAAMQVLHRRPIARVSFDSTSMALPVFATAQQRGLTLALIGGKPGVATTAAERLTDAFPNLRIIAQFDGYAPRDETLTALASLDPDIVVCGMGSIVQEEFLEALASTGWKGCGFTCGGYLDQLANGIQYYPAWVDRMNLRFIYRLAKEPGRLWRRYTFDYTAFGVALLKQFATGALAAAKEDLAYRVQAARDGLQGAARALQTRARG